MVVQATTTKARKHKAREEDPSLLRAAVTETGAEIDSARA
jgi:hypothetical protein